VVALVMRGLGVSAWKLREIMRHQLPPMRLPAKSSSVFPVGSASRTNRPD
jgi:hypothetical protein